MTIVKAEPGCPVEAELLESVLARVRIALVRGNWDEAVAAVEWGRQCEADLQRRAQPGDTVEALHLNDRHCGLLRKAGYELVVDLEQASWSMLGRVSHLSMVTVEAIDKALRKAGRPPLRGTKYDLLRRIKVDKATRTREWKRKKRKQGANSP